MTYRGGKYQKLYKYLCGLDAQEWRATVADVEAVVGKPLPPSAFNYQAWWANDISHVQGRAWLAARWETARVNIEAKTVLFRRKRGDT